MYGKIKQLPSQGEAIMILQKSLRGPALNKEIIDYIKTYILENKLKPGDPLPVESQLADLLGVGRSSVREAVKALQAAGIVDVRHGQGLFVREYNLDSIMENMTFGIRFDFNTFTEWLQIRVWLENNLMDEVIKRITEKDLVDLKSILDQWQESLQNGVHNPGLDEQFHLTLYRPLNNRTLVSLFKAFWQAFQSYEYRDIRTLTAEEARDTLEDHLQIYAALQKRDSVTAKAYIRKGFENYYSRISKDRLEI